MTWNVLVAIRRARLSLTLLAALSVTLLWASPAKAGTTITNGTCPVLIMQSGEYDLGTDVGPCLPLVDGIDIVASGVTLHLDGHTITGSGSCGNDSGIHVVGTPLIPLTLVRILGPGTITSFANGFVADSSAGSFVKFATITSQCANSFGIWIRTPSSQWKAEGNVVQGVSTATGIFLDGVSDNDLVRNNVNDTIFLSNSSNNVIDNNTANGNIEGIELQAGSNNNEIHSNTTNNNFSGILVDTGAMANNITGNTALNNVIDDLADFNSNCDNNKWKGNKFNSASQSCIH